MTFDRLRTLHNQVGVLVDGDPAGDGYVTDLLSCSPGPCCVMQWPKGWEIEDVVRWTLDADANALLTEINTRLNRSLSSLDELVASLKNTDGRSGGLKSHYMAHEEIAGAMRRSQPCVLRVERLLEAVARAVLGRLEDCKHLELDARSNARIAVFRFQHEPPTV